MSGNDKKQPYETLILTHKTALHNLDVLLSLAKETEPDPEAILHFSQQYLTNLEQIAIATQDAFSNL